MARQRACDCCHSRKIHCDNAIPQCNWCKHHGLACKYDRVGKRVGRASSTRQRWAQALAPSSSSSSIAASPCTSSDTAGDTGSRAPTPISLASASRAGFVTSRRTLGGMYFAGYELGKISSHCGIPLFSAHGCEWIKARTGEEIASQIPCWVEAPRSRHHMTPSMLAEFTLSRANLDLPPRPVVESCLDAFRASPFRLVFPVIDHMLFPQTIDVAYAQGQPEPDEAAAAASLDPITAKASIFAFLAMLAAAGGEFREMLPEIDGDACAFKVQHLLPYALLETDVTALETMLMLTIYHVFTGQLETAMKTHSVACRMLFSLGGHLPPTSCSSDDTGVVCGTWRAKVHMRAIFWLCYTFDKDMALRTGQPPCLEDEHCDLALPPHYAERVHHFVIFDEESTDASMAKSSENKLSSNPRYGTEAAWLPGDLRLSFIKSKTYRMLYSADALRKPDAELVRDIRELDEELESWRRFVPAHTRPQLFYAEAQQQAQSPLSFDDHLHRGRMLHRTMLHFEYHYLLATIHRAVGRCRAWDTDGGVSDEVKGLGSSLSLSIEASRATLFYLRLAMNTLLVVSYPMSAILTIFGNIMMHPLHPRSHEDLQLLNLTPDLLKKMQPRDWTPNELANMRMVESFLAELIRLGSHAIDKAMATQG